MATRDLATNLNETVLGHFAPGGVDFLEVSIAATGLLTAHLSRISDRRRRRELTECLIEIIRADEPVRSAARSIGDVKPDRR